ncbi:MAG TPA: hypothetical protein VMT50_02790, partial [Steroidobacteraceae bacterium]|nr:hypothetical protein [Steroidobacteraceae bacterium]
ALALLAGCGGAPTPTAEEKAAAKADAEARGRSTNQTVFDPMLKTEDRARAVEGVVMGAKDRTDAALDEQGGGGSEKK